MLPLSVSGRRIGFESPKVSGAPEGRAPQDYPDIRSCVIDVARAVSSAIAMELRSVVSAANVGTRLFARASS